MKLITSVAVLILVGSFLALGQISTPSDSLPSGPLLKRAPNFSTWTLSASTGKTGEIAQDAPASSNSKEGDKSAAVKRVVVVKTGEVIFERTTDDRGKTTDVWHANGLRLSSPEKGQPATIYPDFGGQDIYSTDFSTSDFSGLGWISASSYRGMKKIKGKDCMVFQGEVNAMRYDEQREMDLQQSRANLRRAVESKQKGSGGGGSDPSFVDEKAKVAALAYIDVETRLPIAVRFGKETRIYEFGAPPSAPLALPPELALAVREFKNRLNSLSRPPAKP